MEPRKTLVATVPTGLLRRLLRLPIVLYRLNLGWLLGERFVLLNHIGRKSGQVRKTVVEIVGHHVVSDTYYVASAWGYEANWYQNLLKTPTIVIQVGRRRLTVCAATVSSLEGAQVLVDYRKLHPLAARELSRLMGLNLFEASQEELEHIVQDSLPIVALRPQTVKD